MFVSYYDVQQNKSLTLSKVHSRFIDGLNTFLLYNAPGSEDPYSTLHNERLGWGWSNKVMLKVFPPGSPWLKYEKVS